MSVVINSYQRGRPSRVETATVIETSRYTETCQAPTASCSRSTFTAIEFATVQPWRRTGDSRLAEFFGTAGVTNQDPVRPDQLLRRGGRRILAAEHGDSG